MGLCVGTGLCDGIKISPCEGFLEARVAVKESIWEVIHNRKKIGRFIEELYYIQTVLLY